MTMFFMMFFLVYSVSRSAWRGGEWAALARGRVGGETNQLVVALCLGSRDARMGDSSSVHRE